jgi:hypothetical protein
MQSVGAGAFADHAEGDAVTALDQLRRLVDQIGQQIFDEGYQAGYAAGLAEAHRQDDDDGPAAGISWEMAARYAESHPNLLSPWEQEMTDSILCSLHFKVPLTAKQKMKMQWIFANRFGGKLA